MWLLLDMNNLAYRMFHAIGNKLSYKDAPTGMIFGLMRDLTWLKGRFKTDQVAFCFDRGPPKRKEIWAGYKLKRNNRIKDELRRHPDKADAIRIMRNQLAELQYKWLPQIGFNNVWSQEGYEADDILAKMAYEINDLDLDVTIVTSDQDLYQCLNGKTQVYNPLAKKLVSLQSFYKQYEILPTMWPTVKAMAGCKSDNIPGIPGIGEKTALKYLRKELPEGNKFQRIQKGVERVNANYELVALPLEGTNSFELQDDEISKKEWSRFCSHFGMDSMLKQIPIYQKLAGVS